MNEEKTNDTKSPFWKTFYKNPWAIATISLAVILLLVLFSNMTGMTITGKIISQASAEQKILEFAESRGIEAKVLGTKDLGSLYEITLSLEGQQVIIHMAKDGEYFGSMNPLTITQQTQTAPTEVPKSPKPKVEAFVFSYCPYGLQFQKALLPVYNILKNKADINIVAIGAMHGEYEKQETLRQLCMQKEYDKDKLWQYLEKFMGDTNIGNCRGDDKCLAPLIEKIYSLLGIEKTKINNCMAKDAEALYNKDVARANELGISGSPSFVINGVEASVARSPDAIQKAICSAFNTQPSECSQTLSAQPTSPGFGYSASSATSGSAQC